MPELAVTSLRLSQFRSHKLARIDAAARPIAIYGANGAGKTNILEAVSMLSPGRGLRRATAEALGHADAVLTYDKAMRERNRLL